MLSFARRMRAEPRERHGASGQAADPGIFIHLAALEDLLVEAEPSGRRTRRGRSGVCPSRSRTTSTSPAARPPPPARPSPTRPSTTPTSSRACAAPARSPVGKTNLDQFATGLVGVRTPWPAPRNALDPGARARRLVLGLGGRGGARASCPSPSAPTPPARAGAGGAQQHRRPEAEPRRGVHPRRGAGLPHARRGVDLRPDRRRRPRRLPGRRGLRCRRPLFPPCPRRPGGPPPPQPRSVSRAPPTRRFFGDDVQAAAFEAACAAPVGRRRAARRDRFPALPRRRRDALFRRLAGRAPRRRRPLLAENPEAVHPVIRRIVEPAAALGATDAFRGFYRLEALRRQVAPLIDA
jgi:allophanate hydrolase